jgi:cyclopropane fatty-acyl-phospholipid synthase-like methyltransferase
VDISKKLVKIADERYPHRKFKVCKVEDIEKLGQKFDLIFSYTTLEHITEKTWKQAVKAMKAVGKKAVIVEPSGFKSVNYCHNHEYEKDFKVIRKIKFGDKILYEIDLQSKS